MATHIISRRIQFIIQYIYDFHYPSKVDLLDFLKDKDFVVSPRTLERDIDRIRTDFGLEIVYNKANQGYFIDKSKSVKVDSFFKFLEIITVADILSESLKDSNTILDFVSFDDSKNFKGIENLKIILAAISQNRKLQFVHENFWSNTFKNYDITPLLLKEYENRWYVIGVPEEMNEIRTFGIDRITKLTLSKLSKLKRSEFKSQLKNFDDIIGLDFSQNKPINIRLLVDGFHIKYMRSLPLHHSQIIHTENEKGQYFVDFFLIPNYEFMTQILKIGSEAEIIYPPELRDEIKNTLTKTLKKYN
jgi:predicted DNA-binding transcriptional regulator YafY